MNRARRMYSFMIVVFRGFGRLGTRMLLGCAAALIAAALIFSASDIGIAGVIGGVAMGGVSAYLVRPQVHSISQSSTNP
jgi:O-antigen ligase